MWIFTHQYVPLLLLLHIHYQICCTCLPENTEMEFCCGHGIWVYSIMKINNTMAWIWIKGQIFSWYKFHISIEVNGNMPMYSSWSGSFCIIDMWYHLETDLSGGQCPKLEYIHLNTKWHVSYGCKFQDMLIFGRTATWYPCYRWHIYYTCH